VSTPCIILAGGGSGGHVFPALALADAFRRGAEVDVVFVGTARGLEATIVPSRGYRLELLDVVPIKGGGLARAALGAIVAARALVRAFDLVRRLKPAAVVSVGGYAAGPVALAAALLGIPVAVVEPNGVAGLANRILGPLAKRAYVAWGPAASSFSPKKTRALGVPLRRGFAPAPYEPSRRPRVFVLGGSQGAAPLNERIPEALGKVARTYPEIEVLHQTGQGRAEAVAEAYLREGVPQAEVVPFLDDVAKELMRADLVVARSGAGTVAEVAAVGRPALFIPFPQAADDHQTANARALTNAGGAVCLPQGEADPPRIAAELASLIGDPARRVRMSRSSRAFGKPDAASDIARDISELLCIPWRAGEGRPEKTNGTSSHTEAL
jgi:UDP-N-acetylglucosamine--N-acetylmuramyl-(pentapeptide) pyrophosphoryl-undecaprenol N-acetylglucosamine transferase